MMDSGGGGDEGASPNVGFSTENPPSEQFTHRRLCINNIVRLGLCRCIIIKFLGRSIIATGNKNSLSTYFLPRIKWLQDGSQILFGKVRDDCVYVLIDTSHSMKSKLDLVKDKIIQLIQVRWSCQVHGFGGLCVMNASLAAFTCTGSARCTGEVCTQASTGSPLQIKALFCQFFFASRSLSLEGGGVGLSVTHGFSVHCFRFSLSWNLWCAHIFIVFQMLFSLAFLF